MGLIGGINLAIKTAFFKDADSYDTFTPTYPAGGQQLTKEELQAQRADFEANRVKDMERSRERDLSTTVAMIAVGAPLYLFHWNLIKKENGKR